MPNTLIADQMQKAAEKPVAIDLDSAVPPRRERPPVPVDVRFDPAPAFEQRLDPEPKPEPKPTPKPEPKAEPKPTPKPAPPPKPVVKTAEQKRAAARKAAGPPKEVKPAPFTLKESNPVRVAKDAEVYAIWNCAESPDESIRVNDERVLRFRRGTLKCLTSGDDEAVALANQFAGNKYIRADDKYLDDPIISRLTDPPTYWYSDEAHARHQDQYLRDHA